nr:stage 0 sporulation family protein [Clostridia bacterium]
MIKVVGIKFKNSNKLYFFAPKEGDVYERNMPVIVETSRGLEYAWVAYPEKFVTEDDIVPPLKPIIRIATQKDTETYKQCEAKRPYAMQICKEKIAAHGLEMKLIDCEYAFDGSKVVFYFTSPGRVDFRELVKDLATALHTRIELRQVGTRDETKYLGGIAPCGRICCCAGNMPEFKKVSVKMAKNQGLSLNPGKISGLCGRLMCCLSYENDYYADAIKKMPKVGSEVGTPDGKAIVVSVNMLKMEVKTKMDDRNGGWIYKDYPVEQIRFKKGNQPEKEEPEDEDEEE